MLVWVLHDLKPRRQVFSRRGPYKARAREKMVQYYEIYKYIHCRPVFISGKSPAPSVGYPIHKTF